MPPPLLKSQPGPHLDDARVRRRAQPDDTETARTIAQTASACLNMPNLSYEMEILTRVSLLGKVYPSDGVRGKVRNANLLRRD
jgi:hypothetical protein